MIKIISGKKKEIPREIYENMLKLRYKAYLEKEFIKKNKEKIYGDEYDEKAMHFIALDDGKVVGALGIIHDKLPLEAIFKEEKKELMKKLKAKKAIEFSKLAVDPKYRIGDRKIKDKNKFVSFKIYKKVYKYLFKKRIDLFLIAVNPCYAKRYEKSGFKKYGKQKDYPRVENNPAVLMYQTRFMFFKVLLKKLNFLNLS